MKDEHLDQQGDHFSPFLTVLRKSLHEKNVTVDAVPGTTVHDVNQWAVKWAWTQIQDRIHRGELTKHFAQASKQFKIIILYQSFRNHVWRSLK
jgi:hypothetical protein